VQQVRSLLASDNKIEVYLKASERSRDIEQIRSETKAQKKRVHAVEQVSRLRVARPQWIP
jgi:hypothetical protein